MSMGLCPTRASRAREPRYNLFKTQDPDTTPCSAPRTRLGQTRDCTPKGGDENLSLFQINIDHHWQTDICLIHLNFTITGGVKPYLFYRQSLEVSAKMQ